MKLFLEPFSGISGNMFLGLLLDLGASLEHLQEELKKVDFSGYDLRVRQVDKNGITAKYVDVKMTEDHGHHRSLKEILRLIEESDLGGQVKEDGKNLFTILGKSEAKIHNKPLEEVHFHEVGAVDSLVDMLGAAILMEDLGLRGFSYSRPNVGGGFVSCAHGLYPVPAPATEDILVEAGIPFKGGPVEKELVTPTGACLLAYYGNYDDALTVQGGKTGYGAGSHDLEIPNVLRGILSQEPEFGALYQVETNIDDMTGEDLGHLMDQLFQGGALDLWFSPIQMKKNRPGTLVGLLVEEKNLSKIQEVFWRDSSSLGFRFWPIHRRERKRRLETFESSLGPVGVKVFDGGYSFEYEDLKKLAKEKEMSLLDLRKRLDREYHD